MPGSKVRTEKPSKIFFPPHRFESLEERRESPRGLHPRNLEGHTIVVHTSRAGRSAGRSGISFLSPEASIVLYALLPPFYIRSTRVDRFLESPPAR